MSNNNVIDYRDELKRILDAEIVKRPFLTYRRAAGAMRMNASYLSKIFTKSANCNEDQLYLLCQFLRLTDVDAEYLTLLYHFSRSEISGRKQKILNQILIIEAKRKSIENQVEESKEIHTFENKLSYYLEPILQIIHVFLMVPKFQNNIVLIAEELNISKTRLNFYIDQLIEMKLVEVHGDKYQSKDNKLHLTKSDLAFKAHQNLMRLSSMQRIQDLNSNDILSTSFTFSSDPLFISFLKDEILKFIKLFDAKLLKSKDECVYQLNLDLFPWSS